jgi:hypothetical protein
MPKGVGFDICHKLCITECNVGSYTDPKNMHSMNYVKITMRFEAVLSDLPTASYNNHKTQYLSDIDMLVK